jgi:hypothetical protein
MSQVDPHQQVGLYLADFLENVPWAAHEDAKRIARMLGLRGGGRVSKKGTGRLFDAVLGLAALRSRMSLNDQRRRGVGYDFWQSKLDGAADESPPWYCRRASRS